MRKKREETKPEKPTKPEVKPKPGKTVNPSEKLAGLLRREAQMTIRVKAMQGSLRQIQAEIGTLWAERERQAAELLEEGS